METEKAVVKTALIVLVSVYETMVVFAEANIKVVNQITSEIDACEGLSDDAKIAIMNLFFDTKDVLARLSASFELFGENEKNDDKTEHA